MRSRIVSSIAGLGLATLTAGCGSSSPTAPGSKSFTVAEAQMVAVNLFTEISRAISTARSPASMSLASQSASTVPTTITQTVNGTCAAGGTIKGTFTVTSDFTSSGTGSQSANISVTSVGCNVSTGSRSIAVDGAFTLTYSVGLTNFAPSTNYTWHETGNFTWSGGSCAIDYTAVLTPQGRSSFSGSFCGQTISYSS